MALSVGFIRFVSSTDATRATGLLTLTLVGLIPTDHVCLVWTHCLLKSPFVLQQLMLQRTMKRFCAMMSLLVLLLLTLRTWARSRAALQLEVLALRHQLQVLQRTRRPRLPLAKTDRWLWAVLSRICWMANGARHRQA
jgi:hypothetical protein